MRLVWTRPAHFDRRSIREYIALENPEAALALDELISEKACRLDDQPGLGRPGRVDGTRELVVHHHYVLVYDYDRAKDQVRILRLLHTARQWPPSSGA